jgi:carbon monoxide dehydrogenase subunit G
MASRFEGSAIVAKPIESVFEFLAAGVNDPLFSPRVQKIEKTTDGPVGVGTVFVSTVKDAGMTTKRTIEITTFEPPRSFGWTETSKNLVTSKVGGYQLEPVDGGTKVTIFNELQGHGVGKLLAPLAGKAAQKDAPAFAQRIKGAVEAQP